MSPRSGGETDKFGNRYEGAWTVRHLLYVLQGYGQSLTVEPVGDIGDGVEFVFTRPNGKEEVHQLKRQSFKANYWTARSLQDLGIWATAKAHVDAGREYRFVSLLPAPVLQDLFTRARQATDWHQFHTQWLTSDPLRSAFNNLCAPDVFGSPENAWNAIRGMWISWPDERDIVEMNGVLADSLLEGAAGRLAAVGLGDLIWNNLGLPLTSTAITSRLNQYGLKEANAARRDELTAGVESNTERWLASVQRELLNPAIKRAEATELVDIVSGQTAPQVTFVAGTAGGGKSAVLAESVQRISGSLPVLAFRLDRVDQFASTAELGERLGLITSPVAALASAAGPEPCLLLIDQLDAISLASGRMPNNFDAVADLIREAAAFPQMKIVLASRQFDIDNDHRIRSLRDEVRGKTVTVAALADAEIDAAVTAMGLSAAALSPAQREILRLPLHLVLLASVAAEANALQFQTTAHLFDAYWARKRDLVEQHRPGTRFNEVISTVAAAISDRQRLSVSDSVLDGDELARDAGVLVSEHVLTNDAGQVAFFHEAFFDYAFARQWASKQETLVSFLTASEQELFRRAQVRQIMHHLRQRDADRYAREVETTLLASDVRFHVKEAILSVLGGLADPTSDELDIVLKVARQDPASGTRLWALIRTTPWFDRMDADGTLASWLSGGTDDEVAPALEMLSAGVRGNPDRVAAILTSYQQHANYAEWLRWTVRFAQPHTSRALFDLLLDGVRAGLFNGHEHELWLFSHSLADGQPAWAIELLKAYFVERPDALALNESSGKVAALSINEYTAAELIRKAAASEPQLFVNALLSYMTDVMTATKYDGSGPSYPPDRHFSFYSEEMARNAEVEDTLFLAMRRTIEAVVKQDPVAARPMLERLAGLELQSAHCLLYYGLIAGAEAYASWAAALLLDGTGRLFVGTMSDSVWVARELIKAVTPHLDDAQHQAVELAVRDLRVDGEGRSGGSYAFRLLSALDGNRLTDVGRRRLGEYQRKFGVTEPPEPQGVIAGVVESPISSAAIAHMTDDNWMQAMSRHSADDHNWMTFKGGAHQLAQVLCEQTKLNPARFAQLALRITPEINPAYSGAILMGLADLAVSTSDEHIVFDCIRHVAGLGHADNDRWLGRALSLYLKTTPIDLVELLVERAVAATDPIDDSNFQGSDEREPGERLRMAGLNSARGNLAESLGNLVVHDAEGSRTAVVVPALDRLVNDPVLAVRSQVAHLVASVLTFDRPAALAAFPTLVATDDELLTSGFVCRLMMYIGNGGDADLVLPVITRMLASGDAGVRERGGLMAVYGGLEWGDSGPLDSVLAGSDAASRKGVAEACANHLPATRNAALAASTLAALFDDEDEAVRSAAASVAADLRGRPLRPHAETLQALISSPAYGAAVPQLFITLEWAPDRVDDLALQSAQRFISVFGAAAGDIRTSAAGDTSYVCDLVIRGLAQTRDTTRRAALLDIVDELMKVGAYGVDDAVEGAGR